jgi:hypothetical protein
MPAIDVDRQTFNALTLAQAAVNFTRAHLTYGSGNQISDLRQSRSGGSSEGETLPRLDAVRDSTERLLALPTAPLGDLGLDTKTFARGIGTGLALYYKAGNCGEHANVVFAFLCTLGFPGITIHRVSSTVMDHGFCLIEWPSVSNRVVSDAWPTKAQACRWSEFFAQPKSGSGYTIRASHTITDSNMGFDLVGHAFQAIDPAAVEKLPLQSRTKGLSSSEIEDYIATSNHGVYDQVYTVGPSFRPYQDYRYVDHDHNDKVNLLSTAAPLGEQWSGKVLPVIEEVTGRLNKKTPTLLNPSLRYTGSRID